MFGLNQLPFYATLRFFGPSLAKSSLVDDLVYFAQELQLEEYRNESQLHSEAHPLKQGTKSVNARSSTIISNSTGRSTTLDNSKPSSHSAQTSTRPTDLLTPNESNPSGPTPGTLLRGWGDSSKPIFNRNSTTRRSSGGGRVSIREPTIVEDEPEEELGGLLRGWGDNPAPSFPVDKDQRASREEGSNLRR
jgi:hypothetical protein